MSKSFLSSIRGFDDEDIDLELTEGAVSNRSHTDCDECGVPMMLDGNCYICNSCGAVKDGADQLAQSAPTVASAVSLLSGKGKLQIYNASGSTEKTRADAIEAALLYNERDFAARNEGRIALPRSILSAVATRFAEIQRKHVAEGHGPFIHRGDVRRCFIATLLRDECGHQQYPVKSDVIADFMQLNTAGFSEGDTILLDLVEKGLTTICDSCPPIKYVERYVEFLPEKDPRYIKFVLEIVEISERNNMCMSSHMRSKIVGSIYLLVVCIGLGDEITPKCIEQNTENTKVNTFMKFYKAVVKHLSMFICAFENNRINYPTLAIPKKPTRTALLRDATKYAQSIVDCHSDRPKFKDPFTTPYANYK